MSDFATNGKLDLDNKKKWEFGRLNAVRIAQRLVLTSFAYKGRGNNGRFYARDVKVVLRRL